MTQGQAMSRNILQSLKETTSALLHQGKVEEVLELSLDYIFSMLSHQSDRLDNLEHSQQRLRQHLERHMRGMTEEVHLAVAASAEAQEQIQTTTKKARARRARHSAPETNEFTISGDQGVSDIGATSSDSVMSLPLALQKGQLNIVKELLPESGVDFEAFLGSPPLVWAASFGHLDLLQYLVYETSADYEATNQHGNNALSVAAFQGRTEAVKLLWTATGTGLESPDNDGLTPLHIALGAGHVEIAKYFLFEAHANPEATTNDGLGIVSMASACGHTEMVKFLVTEFGADTRRTNNAGMTPLIQASSKGHLQVSKYLLAEGLASIDESCSAGGTCLHHAAAQGRLKVVQYYCSKTGINVSATDRHGLDPRCWAVSALNKAVGELKSGSKGVSQAKVDRLKKTVKYLENSTTGKLEN